MKGPEAKFWNKLRDHRDINFPGEIKFYRVENRCSEGMPDLHFLLPQTGASGWIELKCVDTVSRKIKFEPNQPDWLGDYWEGGGLSYVLVSAQNNNELVLFNGGTARAMAASKDKKVIDWKSLYTARVDQFMDRKQKYLMDSFFRHFIDYNNSQFIKSGLNLAKENYK